MTVTPKTTIHTLLKEHPPLLEFFVGYHPEFGKLANPVLRQTMARMATLERVAAMANLPLNPLMADVAAEIERQTGVNPGVANSAAAGGVDPARLAALSEIIRDAHADVPMADLQRRFADLIADIEPSEIAVLEQRLIADGLPVTEVQRLCDVHVQVFSSALDAHDRVNAPAGHPINSFQRENDAILARVEDLRAAIAGLDTDPSLAPVAASLDALAPLETHYVRKENQLFPFLEQHGIEGPSKVMWGIHDDIRALLSQARREATAGEPSTRTTAERVAQMVADMVTKEEQVLFGMALDTLDLDEWIAIRSGEDAVGYAYIDCVPNWPADAPHRTVIGLDQVQGISRTKPTGRIDLDTGALTPEQVNLLVNTIPLDLSFVDENDEVRFFSEGLRIFPRSPGVIGRKVQNCHPPASVHKVQEILDAFRAGTHDVADFWIEMQGRFLHIRYFAMRDASGAYKGTLETVQDATAVRALEGERRLVDW